MKVFMQGSRAVRVNDTDRDILLGHRGSRDVIVSCITELVDLDEETRRGIANPQHEHGQETVMTQHALYAQVLINEHREGLLLLSPVNFTGVGDRVTHRVAEQFVETTAIGRSLKRNLEAAGLYSFVKRIKSHTNAQKCRRTMTLLLASLAMSIGGATSIDDIPREAFVAWLRFYRHPSLARWRPELWTSGRDFDFQCLRELTHAFSRYTGDDALIELAGQIRSDSLSLASMRFLRASPPAYAKPWLELYDRFLRQANSMSKTYDQMFTLLVRWLDELKDSAPVDDPSAFLLHVDRRISFRDFLIKQQIEAKKGKKRNPISHLRRARDFSTFLEVELEIEDPVRPLVTAREISKAEGDAPDLGVTKRFEAASRALPTRLYGLVQEILEEGEKGWPGTINLCRADACDGSPAIYCPVLPTLFLMLFHVPLRVGQAKRLDSGEGDIDRFDASKMAWERNHGHHAGYWAQRGGGDSGYARHASHIPPITGFYINTNKTGAPYLIPWQNERLHRLLYDLRVWQEIRNPIKLPIAPEQYVDGARKSDKEKLTSLPSIFPLFRLPGVDHRGIRGAVPNARRTNEFWQLLMAETERRLNENNSGKPFKIVKWNSKTKQPYGAKYNAHGLRVAGITLMLEQGVPIEIVSKLLAGHKSILMTIYYAKSDPSTIHSRLEEAAQSAEAAKMNKVMNEIKSLDVTELERRTAALHPEAISAAASMDPTDKFLWSNVGYGFCPWDGARCHDGGPCLRKSKAKGKNRSIYGPVLGGDGNCIMCRHFITGPAWSDQLDLHGTLLNRRVAAKSELSLQNDEKLEALRHRLRSSTEPAERARIERDIQFHKQEEQVINAQRKLLGDALWNTVLLTKACERIRKLESNYGDSADAIIIRDPESIIEFVEASNFEQAAVITAAGRVYPFMRDEEAQSSYQQFMDKLLWTSGMTPIVFASATPDDKRQAYDDFSRLILKRLTRPEIRALESGALRLQDFISKTEIEAVIANSLRPPMTLPSQTPPLAVPPPLRTGKQSRSQAKSRI
jgi:hypothetical protein